MNDLEQMAIERLKAASDMSLAAYQQPLVICVSGGTSRNKGNRDKAGVSRKGGASKARSKFSPGIAAAMADQWGELV